MEDELNKIYKYDVKMRMGGDNSVYTRKMHSHIDKLERGYGVNVHELRATVQRGGGVGNILKKIKRGIVGGESNIDVGDELDALNRTMDKLSKILKNME